MARRLGLVEKVFGSSIDFRQKKKFGSLPRNVFSPIVQVLNLKSVTSRSELSPEFPP